MVKSIKHIHKIFNNSFLLTPLILSFYKKYSGQSKDILLAYLVLPLVLHDNTRAWLEKARTNSSLTTFGRNRENYYGLPERIEEFKDITNRCLQYAIDKKAIDINSEMQVSILQAEIEYPGFLNDSVKAAENIYKIFKDLDIVTIYRSLGVKQL